MDKPIQKPFKNLQLKSSKFNNRKEVVQIGYKISISMKLKDGFKLHQIDDECVILAEGIDNIDFSRMISLNESAAYLWRSLEGKNFTEQTVTDLLLSEYMKFQKTWRRKMPSL